MAVTKSKMLIVGDSEGNLDNMMTKTVDLSALPLTGYIQRNILQQEEQTIDLSWWLVQTFCNKTNIRMTILKHTPS